MPSRVTLLLVSVGLLACAGACLHAPEPPAFVQSAGGRANIQVAFLAAVPVGHRITVRWYRTSNGGTRPYEPLIEDLESGIHYGTEYWFETPDGWQNNTPTPLGPLQAGVTEERVVTGRVASCRVTTLALHGHVVQTEVTLDPLP
jgi:hypothetical protein